MSERNQEFVEAREKLGKLLETVGLELNSKKREQLASLLKRAAWLKGRIFQGLSTEGRVNHYQEMEIVSNEWVVNHVIVLEAEVKRLREEITNLKKGGGEAHER